jgi:hypothetical protein
MESDSIRASGSNTLIDLWVEGKVRAVCVTRAAIERFLGRQAPIAMSDEDRSEFVRMHLSQVVTAVKTKLRSDPAAESVIIESGDLGASSERRKGERRKGERRKVTTPVESLPHGERRKGERRKSDRRKPRDGRSD